jgi:uncharacterized protein YgiM (DUF1202 family)
MKINFWCVLLAMLSTGLLAQQVTNPPPAQPIQTPATASAPAATAAPAATNAPAAKAEKKKKAPKKKAAPKKKDAAAELKTVPLVAGPAAVIASNVNVRGQAGLKGEVISRLTKGDSVTVLEEVTLKKSGPDEPSAWAKIVLPATAHAWVSAQYIDATNKTVLPRKLKLRGGPGEQYSVLGFLKRGDAVKETSQKNGWMQIEAPAEACAFVAAQYLSQEATAIASATPVEPAPPPTAVAETPAIAATTTMEAPATNATPETATNAAPETAGTNAAGIATNEIAKTEEPPPKRIVQREGWVRGTFSIQAPTQFELVSPDTGRTINYLYTSSLQLDLRRYKGMRIIVTGEEGLDERWLNTPIITIQRIQVVQ